MNAELERVLLMTAFVGGYFALHLPRYWKLPHNAGDPILYFERGLRASCSAWLGDHFGNVIVTRDELIFHDVHNSFARGRYSFPATHRIKQSSVSDVAVGPFRPHIISITLNVKVTYRDENGTRQEFRLRARDPKCIGHLLSKNP